MSSSHSMSILLLILAIVPSAIVALTANEQKAALNCHNALRSALALGKAQNISGLLPAANNLLNLVYDTSIEKTAQDWADQCSMSHSNSDVLGENLFMSSDPSVAKADALNQACNDWWGEFKQVGLGSSLIFSMSEFNRGNGHATQMAWAKTAKIGCAVANCPDSEWQTYVVCNYSPAGNFLGEPIYTKGAACGGCKRCNQTSKLCTS